jgi:glycosyltransferase involved in cell wall biosynthesis
MCSLPLLSIIIPVLKPDDDLDECIASILRIKNQLKIEIVIVCPAKFLKHITKIYPMVIVQQESRVGIYSAMNDGVSFSSGQYLYFMGQDDRLLAEFSTILPVLDNIKPFFLSANVYWGGVGVVTCAPSRINILYRNICHQGIVYSRNAFILFGPYLRAMRVQADHFMNLKIIWSKMFDRNRCLYINSTIAYYSGNGYSSVTRDNVFKRLYPLILKKYVGSWAMILIFIYRFVVRVFSNFKRVF